MAYEFLKFFDKNGVAFQWNRDSTYQGTIHFPEISEDLFHTQSIFITELVFLGGQDTYVYPRSDINNPSDNRLFARLEKGEEFRLFGFSQDTPETDFILEDQESVEYELTDSTLDVLRPNGQKEVTSAINDLIRIDVYLMSETGGEYTDRLIISDAFGTDIASIELYGVTIGREDRFDLMISRLPRSIKDSDMKIFRESDVDEDRPDAKLLNKKRKQFYIESRNLIGNEGSFKAIDAYLKFFGYYDIRVKEFWQNSVTDKQLMREVVLNEFTKLDDPNNRPRAPFYRLPNLALFYDIVRRTDRFGEDGLPITEKAFQYSQREVLRKLFGLITYLDDQQIAGVAKFTDLVGESVFFREDIRKHWAQQDEAQFLNAQVSPEFRIENAISFIEDARPILENYTYDGSRVIEPNFTFYDKNSWVGYFEYYNQESPEYSDMPNIPIAHPVRLLNDTFGITLGEVDFTFRQAQTVTPTLTFERVDNLYSYRVEWIVEKITNAESPIPYRQVIGGTPFDTNDVTILIPLVGVYDVTLKIFSYNGQIIKNFRPKSIISQIKKLDLIGFYKIHEKTLQSLGNSHLNLGQVRGQFKDELFDNQRYSLSVEKLSYSAINPFNYARLGDANIPLLGRNRTKIADLIGIDLQNMAFKNFKLYEFETEQLDNFRISKINAGGLIQIGGDTVTVPSEYSRSEWVRLANFLNSVSLDNFRQFTFTARPFDDPFYVEALSNNTDVDFAVSSMGGVELDIDPSVHRTQLRDFKGIRLKDINFRFGAADNLFILKGKDHDVSFESIKIFDNQFSLPVGTPVYLSIEVAPMEGKTIVDWKVINSNGGVELILRNYTFMWIFTQLGSYDIEVTITDTNGNMQRRLFKRHINVLSARQYFEEYYNDEVVVVRPAPPLIDELQMV